MKSVEDFGERLFANADEAQAVPVFPGLVPALRPGDANGRDSGELESPREPPPDLAHADDVNPWDADFNHLKTGSVEV